MNGACHPNSIALFRYWDRCRGSHPMPARADIDPLDIPQLMPYLALLDVLSGTPRFRYRLIGTGIVEYFGRDSTGCYVDEQAYGTAALRVVAFFEQAAAGIPVRAIWSGQLTQKYSGRFESVCLPLGKDRRHADMLISLSQRLGPATAGSEEEAPIALRGEPLSEGGPFARFEFGVLDPTS